MYKLLGDFFGNTDIHQGIEDCVEHITKCLKVIKMLQGYCKLSSILVRSENTQENPRSGVALITGKGENINPDIR